MNDLSIRNHSFRSIFTTWKQSRKVCGYRSRSKNAPSVDYTCREDCIDQNDNSRINSCKAETKELKKILALHEGAVDFVKRYEQWSDVLHGGSEKVEDT